jgi:hypothetical protein
VSRLRLVPLSGNDAWSEGMSSCSESLRRHGGRPFREVR